MAQAKTKANDASVDDYIASRASEEQRADCKALMSIFKKVTKQNPRMWGPSIVGYGSYRYSYASGRTGESGLTGFAIRGRELVVYLVTEGQDQEDLLSRLGRHKMGRSCLYFRRLGDLDKSVLEQLIVGSVAEVKRRYGASSGAKPVPLPGFGPEKSLATAHALRATPAGLGRAALREHHAPRGRLPHCASWPEQVASRQ